MAEKVGKVLSSSHGIMGSPVDKNFPELCLFYSKLVPNLSVNHIEEYEQAEEFK
ncbi:MAG: hypothetical protein ACE5K4_01165 [Candidatus Hydrothermarchaeota archaeon]